MNTLWNASHYEMDTLWNIKHVEQPAAAAVPRAESLESQLAPQFPISNDDTADYWEFLLWWVRSRCRLTVFKERHSKTHKHTTEYTIYTTTIYPTFEKHHLSLRSLQLTEYTINSDCIPDFQKFLPEAHNTEYSIYTATIYPTVENFSWRSLRLDCRCRHSQNTSILRNILCTATIYIRLLCG